MNELTSKDYKEYLSLKEKGTPEFTLNLFLVSMFYKIPLDQIMETPAVKLFEMIKIVKNYVNIDMKNRKEKTGKEIINRFEIMDIE